MVKLNENKTYNILGLKANEYRLLGYLLKDDLKTFNIKLFGDNTYGILGIKENNYKSLKNRINQEAQATRGYSDSDNAILKGLCECIGAEYHEQLNWEEIEESEVE